jgi:hypothetical protein
MATKPSHPNPERIAQSFKDLAASAAQLNAASDELAKAIAPIDSALKKLNVGVTFWHQYVGSNDQNGNYWGRRIGYAKVSGRWGLALSVVSGNVAYGPDEDEEEWLFNDAPRSMRLEALDHIPAFLENLVKHVTTAAAELRTKTEQARELGAMISAVAAEIARGK